MPQSLPSLPSSLEERGAVTDDTPTCHLPPEGQTPSPPPAELSFSAAPYFLCVQPQSAGIISQLPKQPQLPNN